MTIPEFSIKRRITVFMVILIVCIFGIIAFSRLGLDMLPELEYPVVSVITTYQGVSSEDIEKLITRPVESVISTVKNVKRVNSTSQEGISAVIVEFEWGTKLDFAAQDVREKLSWVTDYLPKDADTPLVIKFNMSDYPILYYGVTGMQDTQVLRKYLDDSLRPRLERLEGVASVYVLGGLEREINVLVDRDKLSAYHLSIDQIIGKLALENVNVSGGHVNTGHTEYLIRTMGEYKDTGTMMDTILAMHGGTPVYLRDVAQVKDAFKEIRNIARTNHRPSVAMMVMKQSGSNTVKVVESIDRTVNELRGQMPPDIRFYPAIDQGKIISQVTQGTRNDVILGSILAILAIFAFLLDWRPTLTIALAIPISVITTFIGIYLFDYTLNIMTLGGLALAVGMLVDDAIVVIENTFRHLDEEGEDRITAARRGAEEVAMAITASTLTTVVVFLPMVLSTGIAGRLSRPLAVTVTLALFASLFVSLTIVPVLASLLFRKGEGRGEGKASADGAQIFTRHFGRARRVYAQGLRWSLTHRKTVILAAVVIFAASLGIAPLLGTEFMPKQDIPILMMNVKMPVGTDLTETNRVVREVENVILAQPEARFAVSFIGLSRERKIDVAWGSGTADVNEAQIFIRLAEKEERVRSMDLVMDDIRRQIPKVRGAQSDFFDMGQLFLGQTGENSPILVKVFGKDLDRLKTITEQIAERMKGVAGLRDVDTTLKIGKPELQIVVDREKASQMGLSVGRVAETVKAAMLGVVPTKYRIEGDEYDIRVRFREFDRKSVEDVRNIRIASPTGQLIPLYQIADIVQKLGPVKINREDQDRKVTVKANTIGRDTGGIVADIKKAVSGIRIPEGYFVEYGGTYKDMQEAFESLVYALIIAIILIYMVMAASFESLGHPFVIMLTVPISFIGVVFGLLFFGKTLSVPAFMGFIMLCGVVVRNGIVMIDYINRLRRRGVPAFEAIIQGAAIRLRPILITSLTSILGALPMALSRTQGAEMRSPMAIALSFGLLFATLLTLFVIPVVYSLFDRIREP
jgi:HAE1 family hydrophobic/amphiphilic exporter-1